MTHALVVQDGPAPAPMALASPPRLGLLRPIAQPSEVIQSQEATRALIQEALKPGRDFGNIPGVDKPSLLKPGAERVNLAFGCFARFRIVEQEVDHDRLVPWQKKKALWDGPKGNRRKVGEDVVNGESYGLYRYVVECEIVHRESGQVVASCIASCSTMESKYIDRPRDCENTVVKMAEKRAFVGATLNAFGLSEQFTQDVEDLPREVVSGGAAPDDDAVKCPKCSGPMWDNREKNDEREKAGQKRMPDYKCKDNNCAAVIWDAAKYAEELAAKEGEQRADPTTHSQTSTATAAAQATTSDEMTLGAALELPLMGRPDSWGNFGMKPLRDCPDKVLRQARHFFNSKIAEQANPRMEQQVTAIALVLEEREKNSPQESLALVPEAEAPALVPATPAAAAPSPASDGPHRAEPDATRSWKDELRATLLENLSNPQLAPAVKLKIEGQLYRGELVTETALEAAITEVDRGTLPF